MFTHLTEQTQRRWMGELRRVLKPGGLLLLTTAGQRFRPFVGRFDRDLVTAFDRGELVVADERLTGSNRCNAYHPEGWIEREMMTGFELAEFRPGLVASSGGQDLYVLRKH